VSRGHAGLALAVLAVAAIAAGGLFGASLFSGDAPTAPPSAVSWRTEIPAGFSMEAGLPTDADAGPREASDDPATPWTLDLCGSTDSPSDGSRAAFRQVSQTAPAARHVRQIALFADAEAARAVVDDFRRRLADCPRVRVPGGGVPGEDLTIRWEERPYSAGEEALVAIAYAEGFTLASHHAVVRVGNAVYAQTYDGEFGMSGEAADATDRDARAIADRVAAGMCVFAAEGC